MGVKMKVEVVGAMVMFWLRDPTHPADIGSCVVGAYSHPTGCSLAQVKKFMFYTPRTDDTIIKYR